MSNENSKQEDTSNELYTVLPTDKKGVADAGSKICTKCKLIKSVSEYCVNNQLKSGLNSSCKECQSNAFKKYRNSNKKKLKEYNDKWREENKKLHSEMAKLWKSKNPEKIKEYNSKESVKEKKRFYARRYRDKNLKKCKEKLSFWRLNNKEHIMNYGKNKCKNLENSYIISNMVRDGFKSSFLKSNPKLIETKKLIIKTKRLCRTSQN